MWAAKRAWYTNTYPTQYQQGYFFHIIERECHGTFHCYIIVNFWGGKLCRFHLAYNIPSIELHIFMYANYIYCNKNLSFLRRTQNLFTIKKKKSRFKCNVRISATTNNNKRKGYRFLLHFQNDSCLSADKFLHIFE